MKWGIMGAGSILNDWIRGAKEVKDAEIAAIASRTPERAKLMAEKHGIPRCMTYSELAADPEIEAVYIPVPHPAHKELAMLAMKNKKHVLVEKPMSPNAEDAREMVRCAKENGVFLMEAMWTDFFPAVQSLFEICSDGTIGDVRAIDVSFGFRVENVPPEMRLVNLDCAGGSLLDVGMYVLHLAQKIYNAPPVTINGVAAIDTDDNHYLVDEQAAFSAVYKGGRILSGTCAIRTWMENTARVFGTKGSVTVPMFWKPTKLIVKADNIETVREFPVKNTSPGNDDPGYQYEIRHVIDCINKGLTESPVVPNSTAINVIEQCDNLRAQWGLKYPCDK